MISAGQIPAEHPFRWLMLFGASLVYACFGAMVAAMAVLVNPISESLGLSPLQMGTILGAWQLVYLFASIPTGALVDRFGLRPCLLLAGLIMASSSALRIVADNYLGLLLAVMLLGAGGPLISVGAPKLVSRWFAGAQRGLAMGIYMSSTGVGALLATVSTNSVIMPLVGGDWHDAFRVYTFVMLLSVVIWLAITSHPASRLGNRRGAELDTRLDFSVFPQLLRDPTLRAVLFMAITMFFFVHTSHAWLPEILRAKGMSLVEASYWAGVPAVVAILAALIVTRLAVAHRRIAMLLVTASVAAVSTAFLEIRPTVVLALCLGGIGIARSCLVPIALLLLMENKALGSNSMGAASGLFFTAGQIGGVVGPLACGVLISVTGNYDTALWSMGTAMVILLLIVERLRRTM